MKNFSVFIEQQAMQTKINNVAYLMAERNVDPDAFLHDWFENRHPNVAIRLDEAGWWDAAKSAAGTAMNGIKTAGQAFMRDAFGATAQFDKAVQTLTGLVQYMQKDPQLAGWAGSNQGTKLVDEINGMIKTLGNVKQYVPKNQTTQAQNNYQNQGQGQSPQPQGQQPQGQPSAWQQGLNNMKPQQPQNPWPQGMRNGP